MLKIYAKFSFDEQIDERKYSDHISRKLFFYTNSKYFLNFDSILERFSEFSLECLVFLFQLFRASIKTSYFLK